MKQKHDLQMNLHYCKKEMQYGCTILKKEGVNPKMQRPWQGPYIVTKKINDLVYRIQLGPKQKPKVVHRNRLWKYSGSNAPDWYKQGNSTLESVDHQNMNADNLAQIEPELILKPLGLRRSNRTRRPPVYYGTNLY